MGLFTHKCGNTDCGARVLNRARHCSRCGWAAGAALDSCPTCEKAVGGTSLFCWNCGGDLRDSKRPRVLRGQWVRHPGEVGVRIVAPDVKQHLGETVLLDHATIAVVESHGTLRPMAPGSAIPLKEVLGTKELAAVNLLNAREISLALAFQDIGDVNSVLLDVGVRVVVRIQDSCAFVRVHLERRRVTLEMLETHITELFREIVVAEVGVCAMADLHKNPAWKAKLERTLSEAWPRYMAREGLALGYLSFTGFGGENYEDLEDAEREEFSLKDMAVKLAAQQALEREIANLEVDGQLEEFRRINKLDEQIAEMESRMNIAQTIRDEELNQIIEAALREAEIKDALHIIEMEQIQEEADIRKRLKGAELDRALEKQLAEHRIELEGLENERHAIELKRKEADELLRQDLKLRWDKHQNALQGERIAVVFEGQAGIITAHNQSKLELAKLELEKERIRQEGATVRSGHSKDAALAAAQAANAEKDARIGDQKGFVETIAGIVRPRVQDSEK